MRKRLAFQANRIEAVLDMHRAPGRVTGGRVAPRWVRFRVLPEAGVKASEIKRLHQALAEALSVPTCRVARRGAAVDIEIPRDRTVPVRLVPLCQCLRGEIPAMTAVLGVTHDGGPLLIRLPSPDVGHVLITGGSGQGGAALLRTIAVSLVRENPASRLRMVMVNQAGSDFHGLGNLPHLARPVVGNALEAVEALESVERLMRRRARVASIPSYVVLFIDDLSGLLMKAGKRAEDALTSILQGGRRVGIHVVAAHTSSRPALATTIRSAFPVRIVNTMTRMTGEGVLDVEAAARSVRLARAGQYATGDSRLAESDDFIALAQEDVVPFQAAQVDAEVIQGLCTTLRGGREHNWQPASRAKDDTEIRALGEPTETSQMQPVLAARPSPGAPDTRDKRNGGRR